MTAPMPDFDANFLPVLAVIALVLAVEAALVVAAVAGLWWLVLAVAS